jgi:hypothetical protein
VKEIIEEDNQFVFKLTRKERTLKVKNVALSESHLFYLSF